MKIILAIATVAAYVGGLAVVKIDVCGVSFASMTKSVARQPTDEAQTHRLLLLNLHKQQQYGLKF